VGKKNNSADQLTYIKPESLFQPAPREKRRLTAFGMTHRTNVDSVEYLESKAEWKRRQEKKRKYELERQESAYPVDSSWDVQRIAFFNRHKDVFPWVCRAIVKKGHFDVLKFDGGSR
jgi:hypothetical protein